MKSCMLFLVVVMVRFMLPVSGWAQPVRIDVSGDENIIINTLVDGNTAEAQSTTISWHTNQLFTSIQAYLEAPPPVEVRLQAEQVQIRNSGFAWSTGEIILQPGNPQPLVYQIIRGQASATLHYTVNVPTYTAAGIYNITVHLSMQ